MKKDVKLKNICKELKKKSRIKYIFGFDAFSFKLHFLIVINIFEKFTL